MSSLSGFSNYIDTPRQKKPNWQAGAAGAMTGAQYGGQFGGPWGAVYGGIAGGVYGLTRKQEEDMSKHGGKGKMQPGGFTGDVVPKTHKLGQVQQYDPSQMALYEQQFGHLGPDSYLNRLAAGDEELYAQMEAPALRQFNELQGGMASRFSGAGMGARRSSGFQNQSTAAASNFAEQLQSRRQELQRQALGDIMGYSNQILAQRPYDRHLYEKQAKPNYWAQIAGQAAQQIPGMASSYFDGGGNTGAGATNPSGTGSLSAWNTYTPTNTYTPGSGNYNFPSFGGGAF